MENHGTFAGKWGEKPAFSLENQRNIFKKAALPW